MITMKVFYTTQKERMIIGGENAENKTFFCLCKIVIKFLMLREAKFFNYLHEPFVMSFLLFVCTEYEDFPIL